jgi:hypothetical protein
LKMELDIDIKEIAVDIKQNIVIGRANLGW